MMALSFSNAQRWLISLTLLCLLSLISIQAYAVNIKNVRIWPAPDHTRLVFDLDKPIKHQLFTLDNPNRLVIDLGNVRNKTNIEKLPLKDTPISRVRTAVKKRKLVNRRKQKT
jgi:N-acetylmuramoyl-L-alanine amidase